MKLCEECLSLEERLSRANNHYVSLLLQEETMIRDGWRETSTFGVFEGAVREAEKTREALWHRWMWHQRGEHPGKSAYSRVNHAHE